VASRLPTRRPCVFLYAYAELGALTGILSAAVLVFLFSGVDAIPAAVQEARSPQHGLTLGAFGSIFIATLVYIPLLGG